MVKMLISKHLSQLTSQPINYSKQSTTQPINYSTNQLLNQSTYLAAIPEALVGMPFTSPIEVSPPLLFTLYALIEPEPSLSAYKYCDSLLSAISIGVEPVAAVTPFASINFNAPSSVILYPDILLLPVFVV